MHVKAKSIVGKYYAEIHLDLSYDYVGPSENALQHYIEIISNSKTWEQPDMGEHELDNIASTPIREVEPSPKQRLQMLLRHLKESPYFTDAELITDG